MLILIITNSFYTDRVSCLVTVADLLVFTGRFNQLVLCFSHWVLLVHRM